MNKQLECSMEGGFAGAAKGCGIEDEGTSSFVRVGEGSLHITGNSGCFSSKKSTASQEPGGGGCPGAERRAWGWEMGPVQ